MHVTGWVRHSIVGVFFSVLFEHFTVGDLGVSFRRYVAHGISTRCVHLRREVQNHEGLVAQLHVLMRLSSRGFIVAEALLQCTKNYATDTALEQSLFKCSGSAGGKCAKKQKPLKSLGLLFASAVCFGCLCFVSVFVQHCRLLLGPSSR